MSEEKKKLVLVVEDEMPLQKAIQEKLIKEEFNVVSARSVQEAFSAMKESHVDIVWLDHYLLGEKDGLDFVAKVKEEDEWKKLPIFVVSNTAGNEKVSSYLGLGIEKYYIKSNIRLEDIVNDIKSALNK